MAILKFENLIEIYISTKKMFLNNLQGVSQKVDFLLHKMLYLSMSPTLL